MPGAPATCAVRCGSQVRRRHCQAGSTRSSVPLITAPCSPGTNVDDHGRARGAERVFPCGRPPCGVADLDWPVCRDRRPGRHLAAGCVWPEDRPRELAVDPGPDPAGPGPAQAAHRYARPPSRAAGLPPPGGERTHQSDRDNHRQERRQHRRLHASVPHLSSSGIGVTIVVFIIGVAAGCFLARPV
jgi:hypothetical protein